MLLVLDAPTGQSQCHSWAIPYLFPYTGIHGPVFQACRGTRAYQSHQQGDNSSHVDKDASDHTVLVLHGRPRMPTAGGVRSPCRNGPLG